MTPDQIRAEVERLALAAAGDWCPGGGWRIPFDFRHGVVAPTYTPVQSEVHPWRRDGMLSEFDKIHTDRYAELSVREISSGEVAMTVALWRHRVRDITCVEVQPNNSAKVT